MKAFHVIGLALGVAACQPGGSALETAPPPRDLAFVQASCGGCHALDAHGESANPDAPPFARIVNTEGLTRETLASWLHDAHNYPEEMEFSLQAHEVDQLVDYMLTLRDPAYRPPI